MNTGEARWPLKKFSENTLYMAHFLPAPEGKRYETDSFPGLSSICLLETRHALSLSFRSKILHGMFRSVNEEKRGRRETENKFK